MFSQKQEHVNNLRLDNFITAVVHAIPSGPPASNNSEVLRQRKDELESKLQAEIATAADRK